MVRSDKKRIGVFGGTFNPIHHGHLINIELIKENFFLDLILLIPSKIPVHKTISGNILPSERLKMVELAVDGLEGFQTSEIEIKRETASYTITTLEELKLLYPGDELFLIIGSDSFNELDTWKDYKKILSEYSIIVMHRPGNDQLRSDLLSQAMKVEFQSESVVEISSSMIRERAKKGLPIRYLTTDDVAGYIKKKGLYKN